MPSQPVPATTPVPPNPAIIHDLRNLFGVVAAAGRLLGDGPSDPRRAKLLSAIEAAAERGGQLTTDLLACRDSAPPKMVDACARLIALEPMLQALAGRASIEIDCPPARLPVRLDPVAFDAAVVELVANARAVLSPSNHIIVRLHAAGRRVWLVVADNGDGMDPAALATALRGPAIRAAHGSGLGRIRRFAEEAHGRMAIRSRKGRGTVVSLNLPMVISMAVDQPIARQTRYSPQAKEKANEDRQPVAA